MTLSETLSSHGRRAHGKMPPCTAGSMLRGTYLRRRCRTRTDAHGVSCRVWQSLRYLPTENNLRIEKRRKELYWIFTIKQQKLLFFWCGEPDLRRNEQKFSCYAATGKLQISIITIALLFYHVFRLFASMFCRKIVGTGFERRFFVGFDWWNTKLI